MGLMLTYLDWRFQAQVGSAPCEPRVARGVAGLGRARRE